MHPACQHNSQTSAQFVPQQPVTFCLRRLALQRTHLPSHFLEDVVHACQVYLRRLKAQLREPLLRLETGNPRRLFQNGAPVHRLRTENLTNSLLADDRVALSAKTGTHEDVLDIPQTTDFSVQQILRIGPSGKAAAVIVTSARAHGRAPKLAPPNLLQHHSWRRSIHKHRLPHSPRPRRRCRWLAPASPSTIFAVHSQHNAGLRLGNGLFGLLRPPLPVLAFVPVASQVQSPLAAAVARPVPLSSRLALRPKTPRRTPQGRPASAKPPPCPSACARASRRRSRPPSWFRATSCGLLASSTHVIASEMFDLPQPFGPTTAAIPLPERWTSVRSQNDLNPRI